MKIWEKLEMNYNIGGIDMVRMTLKTMSTSGISNVNKIVYSKD